MPGSGLPSGPRRAGRKWGVPAKSASNLRKHGIDFTAVQELWRAVMRAEIPARTADEPRRLVIGQIGGKQVTLHEGLSPR